MRTSRVFIVPPILSNYNVITPVIGGKRDIRLRRRSRTTARTLIASVRRDYANLPVTADIEAYKDRELADVTDAEARPERPRELERLPYPETMPAYGATHIDTEGNLWAAEYRGPGDDRPRWMVFDVGHQMPGIIETPADFTVQQIGTDFVLGRWRDELGVEHMRLYELIKPQ